MIAALILLRDTMAWWGAIAWAIKLDDVLRWLWRRFRARRNGTASPGHVQGHNLVLASAAMGVLSLGLILVGITLPLTSRVEGAESDMMLLGYLMVGWLLISTAGWMFVVARASRPGIMILTAGLALGGMALAAALTAGAA